MATSAAPAHVTLDAFYTLDDLPKFAELADGEVVVTPPGSTDHGFLARAVYDVMRDYVVAHRLGDCFPDGFGYELPVPGRPNTYRVPDASFIRAGRIPRPWRRNRALALAPDLAVEIRSPSDRPGVLGAKLADYRDAGVPLVWVVDGDARGAEVHAHGAPVQSLGAGDVLDGGAVLPGFALPLARLAAELDE